MSAKQGSADDCVRDGRVKSPLDGDSLPVPELHCMTQCDALVKKIKHI